MAKLTKREQFAMAAMQGLLACTETGWDTAAEFASGAVKFADALIAELDKSNHGEDDDLDDFLGLNGVEQ